MKHNIILLKRVYRRCINFTYIILGFLINIIIRIVRPIIHIRFSVLQSSRIGAVAMLLETYLCERDYNNYNRSLDIYFLEDKICNTELVNMYSTIIYLSPFAKIGRGIEVANQLFPNSYQYEIRIDILKNLPLFSHTKPHLVFDSEQIKLGKSLLTDVGLPEGAKYVCFSARDDAYLNSTQPERDWLYHDYRDSDIQNYLTAIEKLVSLDYYAIRVGSIVKNRLETKNDKIIDYATSQLKSEFLDIFILANCEFFIGDTSGIRWIPMIFHKPCIALNLISQGDAVGLTRPEDLILFKKIWSIKKKGYLNLKEIINIGIDYSRTDYYEKNGLELIENTPEEIKGVVLEMASHIHGNIEYSAEDEYLQDKFKAQLLAGSDSDYVGRLGRDYLSQNKDWYLDQDSHECV